jgi:hypothetical protein
MKRFASALFLAGFLTVVTYPFRHPVKVVKVLTYPVRHPVKMIK